MNRCASRSSRPPKIDLGELARQDRLLVELGPLAAPGRLRRLAPFAGILALAMVTLLVDPAADHGAVAVLGAAGVLTMAMASLLPWGRLPRRAQGAMVILPLFLVWGLLRADNGLDSHILPVMALPVVWLALYETRRCLHRGLAVMSVLMLSELLRHPPLDDILRALTLMAFALIILPTVRRLVHVNRTALVALAEQANRDSLTGLANRRGLEAELQGANRGQNDGLGMIFVDLDRFKRINDTLGHDAGDDLLVQVGRRLAAATRVGDVVARIGGDEFVIACNTDRPTVAALADRIRDAVAGTPFDLGEQTVWMSASVGYSHMSHRPEDTGVLLDEADRAMYLVKAPRA